jgi:hypothetical protein
LISAAEFPAGLPGETGKMTTQFQDNDENGPAWMQQAAAEGENRKSYIICRNDMTGEPFTCGPEIAREYADTPGWSVFEAGGNGLPKIRQEI